jgi:creatinine amidohydrolase
MENYMRFGDLTYLEIRDYAMSGGLTVLPTGCTEQQGPHLPVDFDTWFVEKVCIAAANVCISQGVNVLVLPVLPFGPTPEHRNFGSGFIDLPQKLHERIILAALESLAAQGFRRIVVWRGCGQHNLELAVDKFNHQQGGRALAILPELPYLGIMQRIAPGVPGGHADSFCTSIALYLRPESVRITRIPDAESMLINWNDPTLDFSRYSKSGVVGDPTKASAELGFKIWKEVVPIVSQIFIENESIDNPKIL